MASEVLKLAAQIVISHASVTELSIEAVIIEANCPQNEENRFLTLISIINFSQEVN